MPEENVNVRIQKSIELKGSINEEYLRRQKLSHILKAIRSSTLANILVPFLCIPLFQNEVNSIDLMLWLALMGVAVAYRSFIAFKMEYREELITNAKQGLERVALTVGFIGCGWAVGWLVIAPQLGMINHMIYIYGTTAAMISSMFAYSCDKKIFYAFTLPIMLSSLFTTHLIIFLLPSCWKNHIARLSTAPNTKTISIKIKYAASNANGSNTKKLTIFQNINQYSLYLLHFFLALSAE